ncbi:hypothetical protein IRJ41_016101, partial [Triplophysa rosa]
DLEDYVDRFLEAAEEVVFGEAELAVTNKCTQPPAIKQEYMSPSDGTSRRKLVRKVDAASQTGNQKCTQPPAIKQEYMSPSDGTSRRKLVRKVDAASQTDHVQPIIELSWDYSSSYGVTCIPEALNCCSEDVPEAAR